MAKVIAVCISKKKGTIKKEVPLVSLIKDFGIEGDAHAGKWHRQISLLSVEDVNKMQQKLTSIKLKPGIFAENILTEGIDLPPLPIGTILKINNAVVEVTQIGKECHKGCEIQKQTGECIMPKRGIFAKVLKEGKVQKSDEIKIMLPYLCAVLTISDKCSLGEREDTSGPNLVKMLEQNNYCTIYTNIVNDDTENIKNELLHIVNDIKPHLILTTGGTGLSPRDNTREATESVIKRECPGFAEVMRAKSMEITPFGCLSRGTSGIINSTLIINLPGSLKASKENLEAVLPSLEHGLRMMSGNSEH